MLPSGCPQNTGPKGTRAVRARVNHHIIWDTCMAHPITSYKLKAVPTYVVIWVFLESLSAAGPS